MIKTRTALTRKTLTRAIGRRANVSNAVVAAVIENLIDLVSEELAAGGRLELSNFLTLEVETKTRRYPDSETIRTYRVLKCRPGKLLRQQINEQPRTHNR